MIPALSITYWTLLEVLQLIYVHSMLEKRDAFKVRRTNQDVAFNLT